MKRYTDAELLLMAGEMTPQELRTVRAVLKVVYRDFELLLSGCTQEMARHGNELQTYAENLRKSQ